MVKISNNLGIRQEKEMATHSSILAWRTLCTEEPGELQSIRSQRVRHDRSDSMHIGVQRNTMASFDLG